MSYYASNYYRNPGPYYSGPDFDAPVPGWGLLPNIAGAARVGIGQLGPVGSSQAQMGALRDPGGGAKPPVPSYVWWMATACALGGAVAFASKKGWLRRLKR